MFSFSLTRARGTLPDELSIGDSRLKGAGLGVFARIHIKTGAMYGAYDGEAVDADVDRDKINTEYFWAVSTLFF